MSCVVVYFCFFFKQKTAYEMRISDWSSDVCSSDLRGEKGDEHAVPDGDARIGAGGAQLLGEAALEPERRELRDQFDDQHGEGETPDCLRPVPAAEIGRASGRESVCQYG